MSKKHYKQVTTGISYPVGDLYGYPDSLIRGRVSAAYEYALDCLPLSKVSSVLDFGSGRGHGIAAIQQRLSPDLLVSLDAEATYINIAQKPLHYNSNIRFITASDTSSFEANSFDAVFCMHVIEHITEPITLLKALRRVLRKGGTLLLATPDLAHIVGKSPHDVRVFDQAELSQLLTGAGFAVPKIQYIVADDTALKVHKRKQWLAKYWPRSEQIRDSVIAPRVWDALVLRPGISAKPLTTVNFSLSTTYSESVIDFLVTAVK